MLIIFISTYRLYEAVGFKPKTNIEEDLQKFTDWYVEYSMIRLNLSIFINQSFSD